MQSQDIPLTPRKHEIEAHERQEFLDWLKSFLGRQKTLILATCKDSVPACNLMSFALAPGECSLVIVTPDTGGKCRTLRQNGRVSLISLDARALEQDLEQGVAVTLNGQALEIRGAERRELEEVFAAKNPQLEAFARSPGSAVFRIDVGHIVAVTNFQDLTELSL